MKDFGSITTSRPQGDSTANLKTEWILRERKKQKNSTHMTRKWFCERQQKEKKKRRRRDCFEEKAIFSDIVINLCTYARTHTHNTRHNADSFALVNIPFEKVNSVFTFVQRIIFVFMCSIQHISFSLSLSHALYLSFYALNANQKKNNWNCCRNKERRRWRWQGFEKFVTLCFDAHTEFYALICAAWTHTYSASNERIDAMCNATRVFWML